MYNILIAKYGEIGVKGKNRYIFENKLIKNIRNMLKPIGAFNVYKEFGRIYIDVTEENYAEVMDEVRKVNGIYGEGKVENADVALNMKALKWRKGEFSVSSALSFSYSIFFCSSCLSPSPPHNQRRHSSLLRLSHISFMDQ